MRRLLVTGGCGFIGSHLLRWLLVHHADLELTNLDRLTYAGNIANVRGLAAHPRYRFVAGDISDAPLVRSLLSGAWGVVNLAAETHVDRSLLEPEQFLRTNVLGVGVLLEAARAAGVARFLQVSTDEVYGDVPAPQLRREDDRLDPRNPYAAAKAGAEHLCHAYYASFDLPVLITRGANTIGPRQYPEKAIPLFVTNALLGRPVPLYGDGLHVRDWLDVEDHCAALDLVLHAGTPGEVYNISASTDVTNLAVLRRVLAQLGRDEALIHHVADRPGHDRRYAMDASKLRRLGWRPRFTWQEALARTVAWYRDHPAWWQEARDAGYDAYYQRQYAARSTGAGGETASD